MKTPLTLLTALALASTPAFARGHGDPYTPMGSLDLSSSTVRSGTKPRLTWDITYPTTTEDLVLISPTGTVTAKEEVRVQVRVAGVAFQSGTTELPVAFWTKVTGQSWNQNFYGTGSDVRANDVVLDQVVAPGQSLDFAGRARTSTGSWHDIRWTAQNDLAVAGLVAGDPVPDYAPAYDQGVIEDFLSAYVGHSNNGHGNNADGVDSSNPGESMEGEDSDPSVDDEGRLVATIGPRDMIYLFELASRDPGDWWFDMQDLVVIATFEPTSE